MKFGWIFRRRLEFAFSNAEMRAKNNGFILKSRQIYVAIEKKTPRIPKISLMYSRKSLLQFLNFIILMSTKICIYNRKDFLLDSKKSIGSFQFPTQFQPRPILFSPLFLFFFPTHFS